MKLNPNQVEEDNKQAGHSVAIWRDYNIIILTKFLHFGLVGSLGEIVEEHIAPVLLYSTRSQEALEKSENKEENMTSKISKACGINHQSCPTLKRNKVNESSYLNARTLILPSQLHLTQEWSFYQRYPIGGFIHGFTINETESFTRPYFLPGGFEDERGIDRR